MAAGTPPSSPPYAGDANAAHCRDARACTYRRCYRYSHQPTDIAGLASEGRPRTPNFNKQTRLYPRAIHREREPSPVATATSHGSRTVLVVARRAETFAHRALEP